MSLKDKVENNIVIWLLSTLLTGFMAGIGTYQAIIKISRDNTKPDSVKQIVNKNGHIIKINFGHTGHFERDKKAEDFDTTILKTANSFLEKLPDPNNAVIKFESDFTKSTNYDNLFERIKNGDDQIGFMSTYNFLHYFYGKKKDKFPFRPFEVIGYKRMNEGQKQKRTYKSVLFFKKSGNENIKNVYDIIDQLKKRRMKLLVTNNQYSSSSHRIPLKFLELNGVDITDDIVCKEYTKSEFPDRLRNDPQLVAAVSNEDYIYRYGSDDKIDLDFCEIPIPIPYDPIVVNRKLWENNSEERRILIKAALTLAGQYCFIEDVDCHISKSLEAYAALISSPIVTKIKNGRSCYVSIPDPEHDLFFFHDSLKKMGEIDVKLIDYKELFDKIEGNERSYGGKEEIIGKLSWQNTQKRLAILKALPLNKIKTGMLILKAN